LICCCRRQPLQLKQQAITNLMISCDFNFDKYRG
jgi:hypothetical protein